MATIDKYCFLDKIFLLFPNPFGVFAGQLLSQFIGGYNPWKANPCFAGLSTSG